MEAIQLGNVEQRYEHEEPIIGKKPERGMLEYVTTRQESPDI